MTYFVFNVFKMMSLLLKVSIIIGFLLIHYTTKFGSCTIYFTQTIVFLKSLNNPIIRTELVR